MLARPHLELIPPAVTSISRAVHPLADDGSGEVAETRKLQVNSLASLVQTTSDAIIGRRLGSGADDPATVAPLPSGGRYYRYDGLPVD
jgi:hypothetical protein